MTNKKTRILILHIDLNIIKSEFVFIVYKIYYGYFLKINKLVFQLKTINKLMTHLKTN